MNSDESRAIIAKLIRQIAPEVEMESVDPDLDLRRAVDLDSLDFQSLVESVARDTGVEIPEVDYPQVRTLSGLSAYVASHAQ